MLQNRGLEEARAALGAYQGTLGVFWGIFGGVSGHLGGVLGRPRGVLGGVLGCPGAVLGGSRRLLRRLGASWGSLGPDFRVKRTLN